VGGGCDKWCFIFWLPFFGGFLFNCQSEGTKIVKTIRFLYLISVWSRRLFCTIAIFGIFLSQIISFFERKNRQKLKYISLTLSITKLETLKILKYFIFKEKKSVKENLLEYIGIFYFQHGIFKIIIQDWNVELAMLRTISGEKPPIQGKNERERERGVFTVDSLFFNWIFFCQKQNSNQKLKNEVIPEGFQFARSEGKKG